MAASVSAFLNAKKLKGEKASGGSFVRFEPGEYLTLVETALFEKTRKGLSSFKMGLKIVTTSSELSSMAAGRTVDAYVGDDANDMFLGNVKQVVEALFGIFGVTKEMIDAMPDEEFTQMLDDMFMEKQEAAGNYLFVRAVDSGKPNPKMPGKTYVNPRFSTPKAEHFEAAGIAIDPTWTGIAAG